MAGNLKLRQQFACLMHAPEFIATVLLLLRIGGASCMLMKYAAKCRGSVS